MKTKLLIIIGIVIASAVSLSYYAIYDSSTTVFISCDPKHEQIGNQCVLLKPEQYCRYWCDYQELSDLGCGRPVLDYIFRATNLFDEKFDNTIYYRNAIGLPDGVSEKQFEWCVDFIYEKRFPSNDAKSEKLKLEAEPSLESEYDYNFDKTWGGPGNRHPAFLEHYIPEICTEDMIKHLAKYSSMFDRNVPSTYPKTTIHNIDYRI